MNLTDQDKEKIARHFLDVCLDELPRLVVVEDKLEDFLFQLNQAAKSKDYVRQDGKYKEEFVWKDLTCKDVLSVL